MWEIIPEDQKTQNAEGKFTLEKRNPALFFLVNDLNDWSVISIITNDSLQSITSTDLLNATLIFV